jgi:hypothetical protein
MSALCLCGRENKEKRRDYFLSPYLSHSEYETIYGPLGLPIKKERRREDVE